MKTFGYVVAFLAAATAGLYFAGYIGGSASVELTPKSKAALQEGLNSAAQSLNEGLEKAKVSAPQVETAE